MFNFSEFRTSGCNWVGPLCVLSLLFCSVANAQYSDEGWYSHDKPPTNTSPYKSISDEAWNASKSVGQVIVPLNDGINFGSGTYIGDKLFLTCEHVVGSSKQVTVKFNARPYTENLIGKVIAKDSALDVALVELDREPLAPPVKIAAENPALKTKTVTVGHPRGHQKLWVAPSKVALLDPANNWVTSQLNIPNSVISGHSGGALLSNAGELLGPTWGTDGYRTQAARPTLLRRFLLPWNARLAATQLYAGDT